jgi:hypothetical protein
MGRTNGLLYFDRTWIAYKTGGVTNIQTATLYHKRKKFRGMDRQTDTQTAG